jgi:hypothetical protein
MLQNHHSLSKYDKAETCSAMRVHSIKGTGLLRETMNYDAFHSLWCIILGIRVHNLRTEANYTSLPELIHRYSWGILKIQIM